ncbi:MAG TPA: hypothetical protein VGJ82_18155, partial [Thermoanaerobaculia bacterium]
SSANSFQAGAALPAAAAARRLPPAPKSKAAAPTALLLLTRMRTRSGPIRRLVHVRFAAR